MLHAGVLQGGGKHEHAGKMRHLPKAIKGLQARRLGHVPMELCSRREASQPKQHLDAVRLVLGAEEDNGAPRAE